MFPILNTSITASLFPLGKKSNHSQGENNENCRR